MSWLPSVVVCGGTDLKSLKFILTSVPWKSAFTPDMTLLATSSRKLLQKKQSKMPRPTALGQIYQEWFKWGSQNFAALSGTISLTNLPHMPSLGPSIWLQNAIEYCIKVRKTGPAGKESNTATATNQLVSKIAEYFIICPLAFCGQSWFSKQVMKIWSFCA